MKELCNYDSLVTFIDNIDAAESLWYSIPNPGKKTSAEFDYVFPPMSKTFGVNKDAMNACWLQLG